MSLGATRSETQWPIGYAEPDAAPAPLRVEFEWQASPWWSAARYELRLQGARLAIRCVDQDLAMAGRWDASTREIVVECVTWSPSGRHPPGFDLGALLGAARAALLRARR
jgi:hypothetical protein